MKIFLYQSSVIFGDPENNHQNLVQMLKNQDMDKLRDTLVMVPELYLTGYHGSSIKEYAIGNENSPVMSWLTDLTRTYSCLFYGTVSEYDPVENKYYNTGVLISNGELLAKYRKSHLFGPMGEDMLFEKGNEIVSVKQEIGNVSYHLGLSTCYDLRFPGLYQELRIKGVNILLIAAEWPITRINHWTTLLMSRAIETQSIIIAVNRTGTDPDYTYGGHSAIYDAYGNIVIEFDEKEQYGFASVDLTSVIKFRNQFDVFEDRWI